VQEENFGRDSEKVKVASHSRPKGEGVIDVRVVLLSSPQYKHGWEDCSNELTYIRFNAVVVSKQSEITLENKEARFLLTRNRSTQY
jgi:hypothetical protein